MVGKAGAGRRRPMVVLAIASGRTGAIAMAAIIAALLPGGCSAINDSLEDISYRMSGTPRDETVPAVSKEEAAQALYLGGLDQREKGRHRAAAAAFREAADAGHPGAAFELGKAYYEGRGVPLDLAAAAAWFNIAADRDEARAQFLLGTAYYAGAGVEKDPARAIAYLTAAADQGHARAQYLLGQAAARGVGGPPDAAWAARWYGKAAAQGHAGAQHAYGAAYAAGRGVPQDPLKAYGWLSLATAGGSAEALALRADVAHKLDGSQRALAGARVGAFEPGARHGFADRPTVTYSQIRLNALGYAAGAVDGTLGLRTRAAIAAFQADAGLTADGRLTPDVVDRLRAEGGS